MDTRKNGKADPETRMMEDAERDAVAKPGDGSDADAAAWETQTALHLEDVRRFIHRAISVPEDAADVVQQTLLQAHRHATSFQGENFRAWFFTIARHAIADYYRARNRFTFVDVNEAGLWESEPALQVASEKVREAVESRERLHHCLGCLTRRVTVQQQVALLLADFYGFTDKESAAAVQLSLPSFKKLLHKARTTLRAAALGACVFVAEGECPMVRAAELTRVDPDSVEIEQEPVPQGATSPPPPGPNPNASASLLNLRHELLEGLGSQHDSDHCGGPRNA